MVNLVHYAKNNINRNKSIFVDSGNFFPLISDSIKSKYQLKLLELLNYDCINLGEQEIIYRDSILEHNLTLISLNSIKNTIKPYKIIEKNGLKIAFIGVLDFPKARNIRDNFCKQIDIEQIKKIVNTVKSESDVIVLLSQLDPEKEGEIFVQVPEIDILISGKTRKKFSDSFGDRLYLTAGYNCDNIGCILIKFDSKNHVLKTFNIFYPLSDKTVKEDEEALKIVNEYKKAKKLKIKKDCK